jgi:predicted phage baseplate assembly protein
VDSEALPLAAVPITAHLGAGTKSLWLGTMVLGLVEGQVVALQGEEVDADGAVRDEFLTLDAITHRAGYTQLMFEEGIARNYRRDTVTINANVVRARHGETVDSEVLGSGNGAVMHQRFKLKKSPLTHRSAVGGSESELTVRVDGVAWTPVDTLYEQSATDRSYLVQIDNDASATVVFGDGEHGARLPTGSENVTATYRSGIGSAGEVGAGTLTLLKTRPFGIRAVTNPLPASGADDPELLDDARANAPLTVLTLDRIVSLQDYEDYARAYPGIGKARADLVWNGEAEVVHLTVATASGDAVVEPLYSRLVDSIEAARDPLRAVHVDTFRSFVFFVTATVRIDPAYRWEDMEAALRAALTEAFGFEARAFGQPVTAADVVQVMHDEDGVMAVDLDALYKTAPDAAAPTGSLFNAVLPSQTAHFDAVSGTLAPAELLQIQPLDITLTEMNP